MRIPRALDAAEDLSKAVIQPLQLEKWKKKPFRHQVADTSSLVERPYFGLFAEMGTGKTKTTIDAACELRSQGKIDCVLVVAPASVRGVWSKRDDDPELMGEIQKHSWLRNCVVDYHSQVKTLWQDPGEVELYWFVTSYEFIRNVDHRVDLAELLNGHKVLMACDESSFIKNRTAAQTKACVKLGQKVDRRVILNGTPMNNPLDLWSQMYFLHPGILPYANYFAFRSTFARIDTRCGFPKILGWQNLDMLQKQIAPHVVRREKKDCLDLPPKIYLTPVEVKLKDETWAIYKKMRDEAVVWLGNNPSLASQGGVRVMRLLQITSGFLGGIVDYDEDDPRPLDPGRSQEAGARTEEIGREKLDFLMEWTARLIGEKPDLKIITWCWFRHELERVARDMRRILPTYRIYGGEGKDERSAAEAKFRKTDDPEPALLAAQQAAGGFGLNLIAADTVVYMSNCRSIIKRQQSEDRPHRSGQTKPVTYLDILATGPQGQKTVDHIAVKALRDGQDLANWTCSAWKRALLEE